MPLTLSDLAQFQESHIKEALSEVQKSQSDIQKIAIIRRAIEEVRDALTNVTVSNLPDDIKVSNLDEVKLHLRTELNRVTAPLLKALQSLNLSSEELNKIREQIDLKLSKAFEDNFDNFIVKKPKHSMRIDNLHEIVMPSELRINNLSELQTFFDNLSQVIRDTFSIEIPTPQVTVNPPDINIPEVNIPPTVIDLSSVVKALDPLKFISDRPSKPISVRLSDGVKFIKALQTVMENQEKQAIAFSQGINANDLKKYLSVYSPIAGSIVTGTKTVTTAGTAVQITSTSTPCKGVWVSADLGTGAVMCVGDSSVDAVASQMQGIVVIPGNLATFIAINDLNKLWVDAQSNGAKLSYAYTV